MRERLHPVPELCTLLLQTLQLVFSSAEFGHRNQLLAELVQVMTERDGLTTGPRGWWLKSIEIGPNARADGAIATTWTVIVEVVE